MALSALISSPFRSFWMGGFECTDKLNAFGERVDFLPLTGHLKLLDSDYRNLAPFNIKTVREGIRWSQIEKAPYVYDWTVVERMIASAQAQGIQQIWDICHFGFPDDLTPLHPLFPKRFAAVCKAFARFFRSMDATSPLIVTPINEVSFLSWLGGQVRGTSPFCVGQGWEVKYRLMKAYIEGVEALREVDSGVRILTTEPLVQITAPLSAGRELRKQAEQQNEMQFQALDILTGRMCPELRGRPEYLDFVGLNFYYNNQWVVDTHAFIDWRFCDPRWVPLHRLLGQVHERYGRPMVLTETSHPKEDRPLWVDVVTNECSTAIGLGVPLLGVCWYPIIDRPDWNDLVTWHQSGVWDHDPTRGAEPGRVLHQPTARALLHAQTSLGGRIEPTLAVHRSVM
jgi:hypothetical protein